jgi:hypothetical protein
MYIYNACRFKIKKKEGVLSTMVLKMQYAYSVGGRPCSRT